MLTKEEKLNQFLEENEMEIKVSVSVSNQDLFNCFKTQVVNLILSVLKADYQVIEKKKEPK